MNKLTDDTETPERLKFDCAACALRFVCRGSPENNGLACRGARSQLKTEVETPTKTAPPASGVSIYYSLFEHMVDNNNLILVDSQLEDIIQVVNKFYSQSCHECKNDIESGAMQDRGVRYCQYCGRKT